MRLKIAARRSDLARLQAHQVARALLALDSTLQIEFLFKASLGDLDQDSPLVTMGNKGVFTQDFHADLINGTCDLVVHSWKDLPTAPSPGTEVVATLPRADERDLLLLRKDRREKNKICLLSSSPRRVYNLQALLPDIWPTPQVEFLFKAVRGNIPTRLKKLMQGEGDGLIVAKAALDRLLLAEEPEFVATQTVIRETLRECQWMVLPLSQNPCAPAQGALALEIKVDREDLKQKLRLLNHLATFQAVSKEREILAQYGGGCHQKIGVSSIPHSRGSVLSVRGQTDQGKTLNEWEFLNSTPWPKANSPNEIFPRAAEERNWFEREELSPELWKKAVTEASALWVAKAQALPHGVPSRAELIWTAGLASWKALAQRGLWVNGTSDGLGEQTPERLEALVGGKISWLKLTHEEAAREQPGALGTYRLKRSSFQPDLRPCRYFYWSSGSAFLAAWELDSSTLRRGIHASGPGRTAEVIEKIWGQKPLLALSWQDWRSRVLPD